MYKIGNTYLSCSTMTLKKDLQTTKLNAKVFELLRLFLTQENLIVSREDAIEIIWKGNEGVGRKGFTNAIWLLRNVFKELGEGDKAFITIPKVGYQLNLEVSAVIDEQPAKPQFSYPWLAIAIVLFCTTAIGIYYLYTHNKMPASSFERASLTNYEGVEEQMSISNNGRYMAFQWTKQPSKGKIYIRDLTRQNSPLKLFSSGNYMEGSPAWSKSDEQLAYIRILDNNICQLRVRNFKTNKDILVADDCFNEQFRRIIAWSKKDENVLIYAKQFDNKVALFEHSLTTNEQKQITFPSQNETDFSPEYSYDDSKLVYIRERNKTMLFDVRLLKNNNKITGFNKSDHTILENKVSIIDVDWHGVASTLFINYSEAGAAIVALIDLKGNEIARYSHSGLPSSIRYSKHENKLYVVEHISKEYIAEVEMVSGEIKRRISSSSRDMYARYSLADDKILFLSNRSDYWSIWVNNGVTSKDLTGTLGNASIPAVAHSATKLAVQIRELNGKTSLYVADYNQDEFKVLDIGGLNADNLSWLLDDSGLYFHASNDENTGIYHLNFASGKVEQRLSNADVYGIEDAHGNIYSSKVNLDGIWRFDIKTKRQEQITSELSKDDYGSFYIRGDFLYYLYRDVKYDQVKRISIVDNMAEPEILTKFPANTVRRYFGLSSGQENTILVTLKLTNEADITSIKLP